MNNRGFTMVELSVVLVLIGLIVGGVLLGQDLLESAKLRKTTSQIASIESAVNGFREKYDCLPGDCRKAEDIFGSAGAECTNRTSLAKPNANERATCNGNGDGKIYDRLNPLDFSSALDETYRAWQQLASAGFIKGTYTGTCAARPGNNNCDETEDALRVKSGLNVPRAALNRAAICVFNADIFRTVWSVPSSWDDLSSGNIIALGADESILCRAAVFTPVQARQMDQKLDDGLPRAGNIQAAQTAAFGDTATTGCGNATGYFNHDNTTCWLVVRPKF